MITYTWEINSLTKKTINSVDDVVFIIVWEKRGEDSEGNIGYFRQALNLEINDVDLNNFISFRDLTKENVVQWVKNNINENDVDEYILNEIEKSKAKQIQIDYNNLPWNVPTEVVEGETATVIINEIPGMPDTLPDDPEEVQALIDYAQNYIAQAGISS